MAEKLGHSGRASFFMKAIMLGMLAFTTMGVASASAEELTELQYDEQTRSLTIILPESVTPEISVLAPDQLILALPNTQVGELRAQRIQDGVVDNIVLEQATPETAWVVMEFAAGTVLAAAQSAVPIANSERIESESGEQAWQVRPALTATSRRAANTEQLVAATPNASASSLRTSTADIAQAPDFPELPVLEPAVPMNESVSVPPLDSSISVPPFESEPTAIEVEVIPAPEVNTSPVVNESATTEDLTTATRSEEAAVLEPLAEEMAAERVTDASLTDAPLPEAPPFLDGTDSLENTAANPDIENSDLDTEVLEPAVADTPPEPIFIDLDIAEEQADEDVMPEAVAISETAISETAISEIAEPALNALPEETAASRIASGRNVPEADGAFATEITATPTASLETDTVEPAVTPPLQPAPLQPANESRWPDPIPFGQPLPR